MAHSTTYLRDIIDIPLLQQMMDQHYVKVSTSEDVPNLTILCYTSRAQYDRMWNNATRNCRGLCIRMTDNDFDHAEVISRGIPKFFTLDGIDTTNTDNGIEIPLSDDTEDVKQAATLTIMPTDKVHCADKIDGAMCVGYVNQDNELCLHTKGAFKSPEAIIGNQVLAKYGDKEEIATAIAREHPGQTPIFEIITPRVNSKHPFIIDYGNLEELFLLGFVSINTGKWEPVKEDDPIATTFGFPTPETILDGTFEEMLGLPERKNKEGIVVTIQTATDQKLIKVKYQEFLMLQRLSLIQTAKVNDIIERLLSLSLKNNMDTLTTKEHCESNDELYRWLLDIDTDVTDIASLKRLSAPTINLAQKIARTLKHQAADDIMTIHITWDSTNAKLNNETKIDANKAFVDTVLSSDFSQRGKNLAFATKNTYIALHDGTITAKEANDEIINIVIKQTMKNNKQNILQARHTISLD